MRKKREEFRIVLFLISFLISTSTYSQFKVDAGKDTTFCTGQNIDSLFLGTTAKIENGIPPFSIQWVCKIPKGLDVYYTESDLLSDSTILSPRLLYPLNPGEWIKFILHVTDSENNYSKDSISIRFSIFDYLTGGGQTRFYIEKGDSILLNFSDAGIGGGISPLTYNWQPKTYLTEPDSLITWCKPDSSIQYEVVAIDSFGCVSESVLVYDIRVLPDTIENKPEFAPIGAEWYYNYRDSMDGPETGYYLLKSIKDTTIDSKVCRILSHTLMNSKGISMNKGESILYEDVKENRIYRYLFGNFYLLYDFTKTTGDTIIIKEPFSETQYDSIVRVVDSVGIETVGDNIQLKVLYLRPFVDIKYDFQGKIVEKIGNLNYLYPFNQLDCDGGCPLPLRCYNDDQISFVSHEPYAMQVPCDYIYPERVNEFAPIGAKWYYNYPNSTSNDYVVFESKKDSTIQGKDSRVIDVRLNNSRLVSREYIHQNGDSIFYYNENYNSFFLLYDFSTKAGDTITVHPAKFKPTKAFFSYDDSITDFKYKILLVDSVLLSGQWIKRQKVTLLKDGLWGFSKPDGKDYYIINKIGSLAYFFGVQSGITPEYNPSICRCYSDSDFEFKNPLWASECDLISAIIDNKSGNNLKFFPNPAESFITISNPSNIKIKKIELFDFSGRIVQMWDATECTGNSLNIQHISPGVYLLKAETEAGIKTEKLVVQ